MKITALTKKDPVAMARIACRKKFLYYFKNGFADRKYMSWERQYKLDAHFLFQHGLDHSSYQALIRSGNFMEVAQKAVKIESRTNLLFSFEKMALRDAVKTLQGAEIFAKALYQYLYANSDLQDRFIKFSSAIAGLPRKQTRVHTWPLTTVFGFLGNPREHIFLKPRVTKIAAEKYKYDFQYRSKPAWETYKSLLDFADLIRGDLSDLHPQDNIDLQSFIWVLGSDEYPD